MTSRSAAPARKSETTASTEIPQPAIAIPVCPVGTKTDLRARLRASRSSSHVAVIFPIAQSEPTVKTIVASTSRFSPVAVLRSAGGSRRSRSSTPCFSATEPRLVGRPLDSLADLHAGPRILREQDVAVEVDVGAEACDLSGCGDTETRLDHAAEHDAEVECARRVCHAHGFADATGL